MSCLFCRIISGEAAACVVWETPETVGFLDIRPVFKGHVLIVPRRHVATLVDLPDELLVPVMGSARTVAAAMIALKLIYAFSPRLVSARPRQP